MRIKVELVCDEEFVADTLRELATRYEDTLEMDEYYCEHGTAVIEEYKNEEEG